MTNKERYAIWAAQQEELPIFMQPWWMDAVCAGKAWDVLLVYREPIQSEEDIDVVGPTNPIIAALPYLIRYRFRTHFVLMPQETQIGGVWMVPGADKKRVTEEIARQICNLNLSYYYQQFPLRSPIPEKLSKKGFLIRERVTYRIEDTGDMAAIESRFSKNKQRQLAKATKAGLIVDMGMNIEDFYRGHKRCLMEQGKEISYSREFLLVLERKAHRNKQCQIIAIRTPEGDLCAAAFLVWDKRSMYYLIPYYAHKHKDTGAGALLVRESIALAGKIGLAFDFEGSMNQGTANHYRQFGSTAVTYHSVEQSPSLIFLLMLKVQQWLVQWKNKI